MAFLEGLREIGKKIMGQIEVGKIANGTEIWGLDLVKYTTAKEKMYRDDSIVFAAGERIMAGANMVRLTSLRNKKDAVLVGFKTGDDVAVRQVSVEKNEQVTYEDVINFLRTEDEKEVETDGQK